MQSILQRAAHLAVALQKRGKRQGNRVRHHSGYPEERLGDMPARSIERYELYFASGALLNVLVKWLEHDAKDSPKEMAAFCAKLLRNGLGAK